MLWMPFNCVILFTNVDPCPFSHLLSQFVWTEFVNQHIHWGDIICYTHCHLGSCSVFSFDREYAGT